MAWGGTALLVSPALTPSVRPATSSQSSSRRPRFGLSSSRSSPLSGSGNYSRWPRSGCSRFAGSRSSGARASRVSSSPSSSPPTVGATILGAARLHTEDGSILAMKLWFRLIAVVGAGIVEETLFTGYAVTRVLRFTGKAVARRGRVANRVQPAPPPRWGVGPSLALLVGGIPTIASSSGVKIPRGNRRPRCWRLRE